MIVNISLSKEERAIAKEYAKDHSMSLSEAFKKALFEKAKEEISVDR